METLDGVHVEGVIDRNAPLETPGQEQTTITPPVENKPAEATQPVSEDAKTPEQVEGEDRKTVPYERFAEVNKKYNELLSASQPKKEVVQEQSPDEGEYDEALKIVDTRIESRMKGLEKKIELDKTIRENEDFYQFSDQIKEKITENPTLSWSDAYRLSKFDSLQKQVSVPNNDVAKVVAQVEGSASSKDSLPGDVGELDPMAKGPDGKYLYKLDELEKVLPKTNETA